MILLNLSFLFFHVILSLVKSGVVLKTTTFIISSKTVQECVDTQCTSSMNFKDYFECSNVDYNQSIFTTVFTLSIPESVTSMNSTFLLTTKKNLDRYSPPSFMSISVNGEELRLGELSHEYTTADDSCCFSNYSIFTQTSFFRSGKNVISITPQTNIVCLSSFQITVQYYLHLPDIFDVTPTAGPISGGTHVTIYAADIDKEQTYFCFFGNEKSLFTATSSNTGNCTTPKIESVGNVSFYLGFSAEDPKPTTTQNFTFYDITITDANFEKYEGNSIIRITGSGFINTKTLLCFIQKQRDSPNATLSSFREDYNVLNFTAEFIDTSHVACQVTDINEGKYLIGLSLNTADIVWSNSAVYYSKSHIDSRWIVLLVILVVIIFFVVVLTGLGIFIRKKKQNTIEIVQNISTREIVCEEIIGKGSFGDVWSATWKGQEIAVKLIPLEKVQKGKLKQTMKEVELMSSLRHPCVLQFFGSGMDEKFLLIAMELMTNGTAREILDNSMIELYWEKRLRMLKDCASGMVYLHHCKPPIIHRDLKTNNLLVDDNWCVKVSDFGLSVPLYGEEINPTAICGTLSWMAPEALLNKPYGTKIDVYSFGIVLWEFLTRKRPYGKMDPHEILTKVSQKGMRPDIPKDECEVKGYVNFMQMCWEESPENRPTFDQIVDKISEMIDEMDNLDKSKEEDEEVEEEGDERTPLI
ncbi:tyrosine protein kinase, putative [Entamoeba invadens IP1]|uniref:tyrosine protein kinase, putative n=1 Tax=Entamoeba invadens IP1 TaxID=370355 RepID=UPI0002C3CEBD|nr:tyrosine protein kinase, putative [Entamoeba invadens IP1]ELP90399.1 tyrosine protein kinase, putative [Entamoeba invadens IP1]|eukprot:XP_004257170.1 tyrosine protein kinase, putative [Entamoeba invadens IP1]